MKYRISKSSLAGEINASPSKSHSLRSILFATMGHGVSTVSHYLHSPDIEDMITACRMIGAKIEVTPEQLTITGTGGKITTPDDVIDSGNSGQVLRFITALAALNSDYTVITGDHSIRHKRPMQPLIDGLNGLGAFCVSTRNDGYAPIVIRGPIKPGTTKLLGHDSQPVSAILIAAAFLPGETEVYVEAPGEMPWIDLTLSYLHRIGVAYENHDYKYYKIMGGANYSGLDFAVPGDFSSILFPVAAALITKSEITLQHVDMSDVQGDKKVIEVFKSMGANIDYDAKKHILTVRKTEQLTGTTIDVNDFIDAVPILAVVGCAATGETRLINGAIAREKECDRLAAITAELRKMGAQIEESPDSLIIKQAKLHGAEVDTYHDHRMVMSLTVAAMAATGETIVNDIECVRKSYPTFYDDMKQLQANITILS